MYVILLAAGCGGFASAGIKVIEGWTLRAEGVQVTGEVTYLAFAAIPCRGKATGRCPETLVGYRFQTPDGTVNGEARLDRDYHPVLQKGGPIEVRYLPGNTLRQEVEFGLMLREGVFGLAVTFVFLLIGSCAGSYVWWANHLIRMRKTGVPGVAKVSAVGPERDPLLGTWFVTWTDEAGRSGKSQWYWRAAALPAAGADITVYCDPDGRQPAVWEGDCGTRQGG